MAAVAVTIAYTAFVAAPSNIPNRKKFMLEVSDDATVGPKLASIESQVDTDGTDSEESAPDATKLTLRIFVTSALSGPEQAALDVLVAAHNGLAVPDDVVTTFIKGTATPSGPALIVFDPAGPPSFFVFELESGFKSEDAQSQTSDPAFQQKIDTGNPGPDPTLVAGTYRVEWMSVVGGTLTSTQAEFQVVVDAVVIGTQMLGGLDDAGTDVSFCGFDNVVLAAGTRNFKIEYRKTGGGGSARISHARIAWRRIAP